MKLRYFYEKAIETGMNHDPRGNDAVRDELKRSEKSYQDLKPKEKDVFDTESLKNPYHDSRILCGSGDEDISTVLAGVDIETGEILLAEALRNKGQKIDLIMAHHPEGTAYANLYSVMYMQADILNRFGVPINVAEDLMEGRVREVERRIMPVNHSRAVDTARLLKFPFVCLHTPADNMVVSYLQKLFDEKQPERLSDIMDQLEEIPEYSHAIKNGAGPNILIGSKTRRAGKVFVDMTGGTEGSKEIFGSMVSSGINTIVAMHLSEEHRKEADKHHLNVVIAGHISSDNLGMNLLLDKVIGSEPLTVLDCSGFKRVQRSA